MNLRTQIYALAVVLGVVEVAAVWKLSHWLFWANEPWLAYMTAAAFIALLLGSIVALATDLADELKRQVLLATVALLTVQALANVLIGYERTLTAMPADVVTSFFHVGRDVALKGTALLQGGTLSIVSISFWRVLGLLLSKQAKERQRNRQELRDLERMWDKDCE